MIQSQMDYDTNNCATLTTFYFKTDVRKDITDVLKRCIEFPQKSHVFYFKFGSKYQMDF